MIWVVEFEEPYDAWDITTDVDDDVEIRLAVLEFMDHWRAFGPPEDAEYLVDREPYSCAVPGTLIRLEYVAARYANPPVLIVKRFA